MLSDDAHRVFEEFCDTAYSSEELGPKVTTMLQLSIALTIGCYP